MFDLDGRIAEWRRQMAAAGVTAPEALGELEAHLREDVEHRTRTGLGAEAAFHAAVRQLGGAEALRAEFEKAAAMRLRRLAHRGLLLGVAAFLLAVVLSCVAVFPAAMAASQAYSQWLGLPPAAWKASGLVSFWVRITLSLGFGFEIPVVLLTLVRMGLLDLQSLTKARPCVIILNLMLGAVMTTPQVMTMLLLFVPLQILYEASVWTAGYRARKERTSGTSPS